MLKPSLVLICLSSASICSFAQKQPNGDSLVREASKTEVYTPVPKIVTPGATASDAPSDAVILFDGKNLDQWRSVDHPEKPAGWKVSEGVITVDKRNGNIETKQTFVDFQLHIEWRIPEIIHGEGQGRGNSGVFLASTGSGDEGYEIQVLDNYNNATYTNGQAGSIYKEHIPLANACRKPGEWQTYDIIWTAPRFNDDGTVKTKARVTAIHNGVLIQNNVEVQGITAWIGAHSYYKKHGACPIKLQSHGDPSEPISFKNIWVRPL